MRDARCQFWCQSLKLEMRLIIVIATSTNSASVQGSGTNNIKHAVHGLPALAGHWLDASRSECASLCCDVFLLRPPVNPREGVTLGFLTAPAKNHDVTTTALVQTLTSLTVVFHEPAQQEGRGIFGQLGKKEPSATGLHGQWPKGAVGRQPICK
jgi:hypothetical protein